MSRMMACPNMEIGAKYIESLATAGQLSVHDGKLIIQTDKGELIFETPKAAELENTKWVLGSTASELGIVSMAIDENIFFTISNGEIGGNGGCNGFGGTVEIDGNSINIGQMISTQMFCEEDGISEREQELFAILGAASSYEILRQTLTLFDGEGSMIATFRAAENDPVIKTLFVGPEQVDCVGVAPQKCLLVKETPDADYTFFYDSIDGFEWEAGYEYELLVRVTEVENPPADGSSLRYELVEIVSKTEAG